MASEVRKDRTSAETRTRATHAEAALDLAPPSDQAFPRSAITGVRAVPDCIAEVHGLKWAGTELPGIRVGSFDDADRLTFAVCHGHSPGIVIDLANSKYATVILTVENPEDAAARLSAPPG